MKANHKMMAVGAAMMASSTLCATGLIPGVAPVTRAASRTVTITYPSGGLATLDPIDFTANILVDPGTLFEGLYGYNTKNQIVPKIATRAVPSNGGRVWTIYMRHNAKWSNGKPVTAQDFYYAWMRMLAPNDSNGAIWSGVTQNILNAYAYHAGGVPASRVGIQVVNNFELKLTLSGATNIKGLLALSASMPLYPPAVEQHPSNWFSPQYFVGDGPYVVHRFTPNGTVVLTRNPHYVGGAGYNVGNVPQINLIPSPTVPVEDYQSGVLDVALITSASDFTYAKSHFKGQLHQQGEANVNYLGYDHSVEPSPLDQLAVREAIAMAINRTPIASKVLDGMVGVTTVYGYPGFPTYSLEKNPYRYNVQAARKLLAKAGYPGGKGMPTLRLYTATTAVNNNTVLMAEAIAQELKTNLGIHTKIDPTNNTVYGVLQYGGIEKGIRPGYVVGTATAPWNQMIQWPMDSDNWVMLPKSGDIPDPGTNFQRYATNWYYQRYDPVEVKAWGNPTNPSMGISYAQWQPIIRAAATAIKSIEAWRKAQPAAYQAAKNVPGTPSLGAQLKHLEAGYSQAKTNAAKHTAWVQLWQWAGSYPSGGNTGASIGVVDQAYVDAHEPPLERQMRILEAELGNTGSSTEAAKLSAQMNNVMVQSALTIPLNYNEAFFLEKPWVAGAQATPWAWGPGFYQFQYLNLKK